MKNIVRFVLACLALALVAYGGWTLQQDINWKMSYESQVDAAVEKKLQPIRERLDKLERNSNARADAGI